MVGKTYLERGEPVRVLARWSGACDECDYLRLDRGSGVHQTTNPKDWRGALIRHELRPAVFAEVAAPVSPALKGETR